MIRKQRQGQQRRLPRVWLLWLLLGLSLGAVSFHVAYVLNRSLDDQQSWKPAAVTLDAIWPRTPPPKQEERSAAEVAATAAFVKHSDDSYWDDRRRQLLDVCGALCQTNRPVAPSDFGYFGRTTAAVDCPALFRSTLLDEAGAVPPPRDIPQAWRNDYRMDGRVVVESWYIRDVYLGKQAKQTVWTQQQIDEWKVAAMDGDFSSFGNYQVIDRSTLLDALQNVAKIQNQTVLVVGSEKPWVEALCLAAGAAKVVTLEYGAITSHHPQVETLTPSEFRANFLKGTLGTFDAVVSYSSLEHSGLGRYGDALNPWGDLMALARAWCVTKASGSLTLGLSSADDHVYFNAGRIYGPARWPYMATNWRRVNYTSGWGPEVVQQAPQVNRRLRGPPGHQVFWNQSSLVFRKTGPPGSVHELHDLSLLIP
jgi:hypothetical protein